MRLKELRTEKGLTQSELGKILKISPSTIGMYEQNRREPDLKTLKKIANYFNVSTDYLLGLNCNSSSISSKENVKQNDRVDKALELLEKFEQLPYDKQRAIEILIGMSEQAATRLPEAK